MSDEEIENDDYRRPSLPGFYYNKIQSYQNYETAYLNALLLLGVTQTPEDLRAEKNLGDIDSHPMEALLRNAYKFGYILKMYKNIKSIVASPGVIMCKINRVWHASDAKRGIFVDSFTGSIKYEPVSDIVLMWKFVKL